MDNNKVRRMGRYSMWDQRGKEMCNVMKNKEEEMNKATTVGGKEQD